MAGAHQQQWKPVNTPADARLALDQHSTARPPATRLQAAGQLLKLGRPADQVQLDPSLGSDTAGAAPIYL